MTVGGLVDTVFRSTGFVSVTYIPLPVITPYSAATRSCPVYMTAVHSVVHARLQLVAGFAYRPRLTTPS
jgi:hypothetical protein